MKRMPVKEISNKKYSEFINSISFLKRDNISIDSLRDKEITKITAQKAMTVFSEEITNSIESLSNIKVGSSVIDIPYIDDMSEMENSYWGIITSLSITMNIFTPINDKVNDTPFSLYNSSSENQKELLNAGLKFYKPDDKLGFHTDGTLNDGVMSIPKYLMLYNIFLGYKKPGEFYWIPFEKWSDFSKMHEKFGIGKKYKLKPTPIVHKNIDGKVIVAGDATQSVPIFSKGPDGNVLMLLNGENVDNNVIFDELTDSLLDCDDRLYIEQKTNRIILLNNHLGCHARQVFEEPIQNTTYTRSMLRSVSRESFSF